MEEIDENDALKIANIFFKERIQSVKGATDSKVLFAHYTNATSALSIIRNKSLWMRQASDMNDFSEIEQGIEVAKKVFVHDQKSKQKLWSSIEKIMGNERQVHCQKLLEKNLFRDNSLPSKTFILCVSEHDKNLDQLGRLSMWRAYGADTGVAFIFNSNTILGHSQYHQTNSQAVFYWDTDRALQAFLNLVQRIEESISILSKQSPDRIKDWLLNSILELVTSIKHPAFLEEREWRISLQPSLHTNQKLIPDLEIIRGLPQQVYKIPLHTVEDKYYGDLNDTLHQIIIGPCKNAEKVKKALVDELTDAGVHQAKSKIVVSNIPLRL